MATPMHYCTDSFSNSSHAKEGETKLFLLDVDYTAPTVSCSLGDNAKTIFIEQQSTFMYNTLLKTEFEDDCPASGTLDVVVRSNELDEARMVYVANAHNGQSSQPLLLVASDSCENSNDNGKIVCIQDPANTPRFYRIVVKGTDGAGNVATDSCQVIVLPKNEKLNKLTEADKQAYLAAVDASTVLYEINSDYQAKVGDTTADQVVARRLAKEPSPKVARRLGSSKH